MTNRGRRDSESNDVEINLSDDEIERRLGGGAGLGSVSERAPVQAPKPKRGRGGGGSLLWRDVGLVLVLLVFLGAGANFVLNPAHSTNSPTPFSSEIALASPADTPVPTEAAAPTDVPVILPSDVIPSLAAEATPTPVPTATPVPTDTPVPTPTVAPTPTPTGATASVTLSFLVRRDSGGTYTNTSAGLWTVKVKVGATTIASLPGSTTSHTVKVPAGKKYVVSTTGGPSGYQTDLSGDCATTPPANASEQCSITEDDLPAKLTVKLAVPSTTSASAFTVTLNPPNADPSPQGPQIGSAVGVDFHLDANIGYTVDVSGPPGYVDDANCDGSGLASGAHWTCTIYVTSITAPSGAAPVAGTGPTAAWSLAALLPLLPRRRDRHGRADARRA